VVRENLGTGCAQLEGGKCPAKAVVLPQQLLKDLLAVFQHALQRKKTL
jgi:hypothetical protein